MTCVVAVESSVGVVMGADSNCGGEDADVEITVTQPKVFQVGPLLLGAAGRWRFIQSLRYYLDASGFVIGADPDSLMATDFPDLMNRAMKVGGVKMSADDALLVGCQGCIYEVDNEYAALRPRCGYTAIGTGAAFAVGALSATDGYDITPRERVKLALTAAVSHSPWVREPFTIIAMLHAKDA